MFIVFLSSFFIPFGVGLSRVYFLSSDAEFFFKKGIGYIESAKFAESKDSFEKAHSFFLEARQRFGIFMAMDILSNSSYINENRKAVDNFLEVGVLMSSASIDLFSFIENQSEKGFNPSDFLVRLNKIKVLLDEVDGVLGEIDTTTVMPILKDLQGDLVGKVDPIQRDIVFTDNITRILSHMAGYKEEKKYLILLLNPTELRPGGGFIGTYGVIKLKDGKIVDLFIDDTYNLDKNSPKGYNETPPELIKKHLGQSVWFFRDSNWSPDFKESSEQALLLYEREGGHVRDFNGVIALNPYVIGKILDYYGGISLDGINYTSENLVEVLQYKVEKEFWDKGIPVEERKRVIGFLTQRIIDRVKGSNYSDYKRLFEIVKDSLGRKDILLYEKDDQVQALLDEKNWSGRIKPIVTDDYIMVVDANLGSLKTDGVMEKSMKYELRELGPARYRVSVDLEYKNMTEKINWRLTRYQSYTRLFLPADAKIISLPASLEFNQESAYGDKKSIGFYWVIEPGMSRKLRFVYELDRPDDLIHSLYIQKQPGANRTFSIDAQLNGVIKSLKYNNQEISLNQAIDLHDDALLEIK